MIKQKNRITSLLLVLAMVLTMISSSMIINTQNANAASYSFTRSTIKGSGDTTSKFTINKMTGLYQNKGSCSIAKGTANITLLKTSDNRRKLAYYYGYKIKNKWVSGTNGCKLARAFYYSWSGKAYKFSAKTLKNMINAAKKVSVPALFRAYECKPKTNTSKSFICWRMAKPAYVTVQVTSTDKSTLSNSFYSLKGIKINLYKKNKTTVADTLTCNAKGKTNKSKSLSAGTYYIKETSVPSGCGYSKNKNWYQVTAKEGKTVNVSLKNTPKLAELNLKTVLSSDSNQGNVSGFTFSIKNNSNGSEMIKTTDSTGIINIKNLKPGKYTIAEVITNEQGLQGYTSVTNAQTITLIPGKTTVTWVNKKGIDAAQKAVNIAISHVGKINYKQTGTKDWNNLDCGAMVQFAYRDAGINLGKIGTDRIRRGEIGKAVKKEGDYGLKNAKPGDIIMRTAGEFYNTTKYAHVGLYAGNYKIVEVMESGVIRIASLTTKSRWGENGAYIKLFRVI